jgi:hypothetical protein
MVLRMECWMVLLSRKTKQYLHVSNEFNNNIYNIPVVGVLNGVTVGTSDGTITLCD